MAWTSRSQYEEVQQLGQGNFHRVVLVQRAGCPYAVKEVNLAEIRLILGKDKETAERCINLATEEASNMMSFQHENIIRVFGFFLENEIYHMVMEYWEGGDLERAILEGNYFEEHVIRRWIKQIVLGLQFLHGSNVVHSNVKTENIFLFEQRKIAKLGDFGVTNYIELCNDSTKPATTDYYVAPEMIQGEKPYSFPNDVWALGLVTYRTAALKFPFDHEDINPLQTRYSIELAEFVGELLELDPEKRPTIDAVSKLAFLQGRTEDIPKKAPGKKSAETDDSINKDSFYNPALFKAASDGKTGRVKRLIKEGADVNAKNKANFNWSALHLAAINGHTEAASILLEKGADINCEDTYGYTALHRASNSGHYHVAALLIEKGADINVKSNSGWTALHCASMRGHKYVVGLLLDKGADVDAETNSGYTALHWASITNHADVAELLIEWRATDWIKTKDGGYTALHFAAINDNIELVTLLLEKGTEVNAIDNSSGSTALHFAANNGNADIASLLLEKGADVNAKSYSGSTPLHYASMKGHKKTVDLLIEKGANASHKSYYGHSALYWASRWGPRNIVWLLKKHGAK